MNSDIHPGKEFTHEIPFHAVDAVDSVIGDVIWSVGCLSEQDEYERYFTAHGLGTRTLKVVSIHNPGGKYHDRVFYIKWYTKPNGGTIAKSGLQVATIGRFQQMLNGFGYEYEMEEMRIKTA